ncbi:SusC/RagA family TonB-linked outer membrane protein [Hymenobacter sp. BT635]|uniref:SusC/RagA family TonB-linked outer membrane protein n=1 Tax=Hymenobacter nitidus TaxID=2880929 RepID=A0ABS8AEK9_9BACT|nr:SusC/RagA family TonB-linked outer membrane protein [Hymenobacter nitidus]MCB2378162.1 SusC/RagA family TonB-linked outer membrane protein [Hymenobacter nitidus]
MKKLLFMVILLMTSLLQQAIAQDRTISGRVTDRANGQGLPGVTVIVKGTTVGASTGADGSYSLSVPATATTLSFTSIGYVAVDRPIGTSTTIDVGLNTDTKQLGEVVVTALGREEQKKSLGYSVQDVKGAELTQARETNVVNSLTGKVAGVQISNSSGTPGSSSRILIRGAKSIQNNNQPLFVIDGQPIDNSNFTNAVGTSPGSGGVDYGNGASDINPDDIESMTVLKGANAAALYGTRGVNGVVVITTKSGRKSRGIGISVNSTTSFETPLVIPKFQDQYGQGYGSFEYVDGAGGGDGDNVDESWGPKLDGRLIPQYNSPVVNGVRVPTPWVSPGKDNVRNFFETGRTLTNNVALSGGNDKAGIRVSFTNLDQKGILPNTFLKRNTVNVNGGVDITNKFKLSTNINYSNTRGRRPSQGYDELNVMQQLYTWFGRQVKLSDLKDIYEQGGREGSRNYNWIQVYSSNPYYILNECTNDDERDRVIGNLTLTYALTDWLNLTARTTNDIYNQFNQRRVAPESRDNAIQDDYTEERIFVLERNTEFLATVNRNLTEDINIDGLIGANRRDNRQNRNVVAAPELAVPGLYSLGNAGAPLVTGNNFGSSNDNNANVLNPVTENRINSIYGSARLGYKNFAFLGITARNDWTSTLPANNRSFFYPSVDASLVLTEALGITESVLSFAKVRGGYAQVGNDTNPYQLEAIYPGRTPFGSNAQQTYFNTLFTPDLKPERTNSVEAGFEVRFLQDRIGLDVTAYQSTTTDQILNVPVSGSTGYLFKVLNAGEVSNKGVEAILNIAPLPATSAFQWNITTNFAANRNKVVKFDDEGQIKNLILGASGFGVNIEARIGEKYGVIFAEDFLRAPDGQIIYDGGLPVGDPNRKILGSYTPDWVGGITNRFGFKGVDFSFTIDTRQGGQLQSETNMWGNYTGSLANTIYGRETGIIGEGVMLAPDGVSYIKNDVPVSAQDYYGGYYYGFNGLVRSSSVYDASFVKLREVRLGYQLPKSIVDKTFLKGIGVSAVGRNLWLISSKVPGIDPETSFNSGNVQGLESTQIPSVRSYGFNINLTL